MRQVWQVLMEISYYSEGAIPLDVAYALPVSRRKFVYDWLVYTKNKEKEEVDKASSGNTQNKKQVPKKIHGNQFKPKTNQTNNLNKYKNLVKTPPVKK